MSKTRLILVTLALIFIGALGFIYFYTHYHYVDKVVWRGLQGDAKRDPYYLTEQFLQKKGYDITRKKNYARLSHDDLTDVDTLFFTNDAHTLSKDQASDIINWVENGGDVVVFAGPSNYEADSSKRPLKDFELTVSTNKPNPFFEQSGIAVVECSHDDCACPDNPKESLSDKENLDSAEDDDEQPEKTVEQKIDDLFTPYTGEYATTFSLGGNPITVEDYGADWLYAKETGKAKLRYPQTARCYGDIFSVFDIGKGTITVYNNYPRDFGHFGYYSSIWENGNATFLSGLLQVGNGKRILWFENTLYPSFWTFIWQYGLFAIVAGILLLLAWVWQNSRRFGSLIVEDERKGLTLERHLRATGQFYYQNEQANMLLQNCYEQLDKKIARRIANHKNLKRPELAEQISEITGFSPSRVQQVLERRFPQSDSEFTQLIHYINNIQKKL